MDSGQASIGSRMQCSRSSCVQHAVMTLIYLAVLNAHARKRAFAKRNHITEMLCADEAVGVALKVW